jgi:hypothetical protein
VGPTRPEAAPEGAEGSSAAAVRSRSKATPVLALDGTDATRDAVGWLRGTFGLRPRAVGEE